MLPQEPERGQRGREHAVVASRGNLASGHPMEVHGMQMSDVTATATTESECPLSVHFLDNGMGMRTSQDRGMQHFRENHVMRIDGGAAHALISVHARNRFPDNVGVAPWRQAAGGFSRIRRCI